MTNRRQIEHGIARELSRAVTLFGVTKVAPLSRWRRLTACLSALLAATSPQADEQADALLDAVDACFSTSLSFDKRPLAMPGFVSEPGTAADFNHVGWANTLSFPIQDRLPYPLAGPELLALRPDYENYVIDWARESRWLAQNGLLRVLRHPSGWTVVVERDEIDDQSAFCSLWTDDLTEDGRRAVQQLTGYFQPHPVPFARVTDLASWHNEGFYDYDRALIVVHPDTSILTNTAEVYVLTTLYAYDLREEY